MLNKLTFQKVKSTDLEEIIKLFKIVFKKKISKKFYNWRYFDNSYYSFVAKLNKKIIAHIGFIKYQFGKNSNIIFSRHSTFVIPKFQNKGIYHKLLLYSFSILKKKSNFIIAWPNEKNIFASKRHSNFNIIGKYNLFYKNFRSIKKKNYLKKINSKFLANLQIDQDSHLFFKDRKFIKWRYDTYKNNKFYYPNIENLDSFILQKNIYKKKNIYSIIDYFGNQSNYFKKLIDLLKYFIKNKISFQLFLPFHSKKLIYFFSKENILKKKIFYVGLYTIGKNINIKKKIETKIKKVVKISDTDVFIETF